MFFFYTIRIDKMKSTNLPKYGIDFRYFGWKYENCDRNEFKGLNHPLSFSPFMTNLGITRIKGTLVKLLYLVAINKDTHKTE